MILLNYNPDEMLIRCVSWFGNLAFIYSQNIGIINTLLIISGYIVYVGAALKPINAKDDIDT